MAQIVKTPIALSPQETGAALQAAFPPEARHSGKVRDSYRFTRKGVPMRLVYVTDRRSIFDFKLGFPIDGIGVVLNAFNLYWRGQLDEHDIPHDLIAMGSEIDKYLPKELRGNPELWKRAIIVLELRMIPVESVMRRYITGTGWKAYQETGEVCGQKLPEGLKKGQRLDTVLFTPTTKAQTGHDMPLHIADVNKEFPFLEQKTRELFGLIEDRLDRTQYLLFVDGKAEGGFDPEEHTFMWADEIGTPDACRFWRRSDYENLWPLKVPDGYDKQYLREWGVLVGIDKLDPEDEEHQLRAKELKAPDQLIYYCLQRYREVFEQVAGIDYVSFGELHLGIPPAKRMF